jgi:hypothetical protein
MVVRLVVWLSTNLLWLLVELVVLLPLGAVACRSGLVINKLCRV